MSDRRRDLLALVAWTAFLVLALAVLHSLGGGPLSAPPVRGTGRWLASRDAATALFALVRLVLLAVGWYLLVSTVLATALRLIRADAAARAVEACAPAPVRRWVRAATGLSLAASMIAASAASASEADAPVMMRRLPDAASTVTMTRLPDAADEGTQPALEPSATWTVASGDHLWSIARRTLLLAWRVEPSDAEVDPYWRALIAKNRARIPDPRNPDLIVPGLVLDLPTPPNR